MKDEAGLYNVWRGLICALAALLVLMVVVGPV